MTKRYFFCGPFCDNSNNCFDSEADYDKKSKGAKIETEKKVGLVFLALANKPIVYRGGVTSWSVYSCGCSS